jgi:hypothetical protein
MPDLGKPYCSRSHWLALKQISKCHASTATDRFYFDPLTPTSAAAAVPAAAAGL